MRILPLFFWTERRWAIVNRSPSEPWKSLSKWYSCNFSNNGKKCSNNEKTCRLCLNSLRSPLNRGRSYSQWPLQPLQLLRPLILLRSCGKIIGRGFSPLRELMLFQMTERLRFFSPTSRWRCISYFQTLLHKKCRRRKSTILRWSRLWRVRECRPGKWLHRADHWWFRPLLAGNNQGRNWFRQEVRSEVELPDGCSARAFHDFSDLTWPGCRHLPGQSWWNHNHHPIFALILQ